VIVVQSRGVARWLSLRLADRTAVCANVRFPVSECLRVGALPAPCAQTCPSSPPFDPEVLAWRILAALEELEPTAAFAPSPHTSAAITLRRYELSARLAQLYDEYLVYRPDWIEAWEQDKPPPHWQAALWQRLAKEGGRASPRGVAEAARRTLARPKAPGSLPQRVSIFRRARAAAGADRALHALARHSDVHVFVPNPVPRVLGRYPRGRRHRAQETRAQTRSAVSRNRQQPARLARQAGARFHRPPDRSRRRRRGRAQHFVEPALRACSRPIQSDILDLEQRTPGHRFPPATARSRSTVATARCAKWRCIHDQLLALFGAASDLEPSDVVVMTPDIETYAPYVEAVFGTAEPRIPFNISDRSAEHESTLAATLLALLALPGSRYDANRVLAILDEEAVQRRIGLTEADLETVRHWVREAGIRWGIDAQHARAFSCPPRTSIRGASVSSA
jgi:exodeoxyribonuclease V gamma subunit